MIKTLSLIRQPSYQIVETLPNSPSGHQKVDFQLLFQNQKSNLQSILIISSFFHLILIVTQAIFMNQGKTRLIQVYFMIQIIGEGLIIGINFLIIVLLKKQEFQNLKNSSLVQISDLKSPLYLFQIFMNEFIMFSYCYKLYSLIQIEVIGFGTYLVYNELNYFILVFMILGAVKLIIIIGYQILVKRNSEINYALEATSYRINVRTEPKECIICLENLRVQDNVNNLPCDKDHIFHSKCIEQWLAKTNQCPMCRKTPEYI